MTKLFLGKLEKEVLNILWKEKGLSIKEVWERLCCRKKLAYTTVATVLQRLCKKGWVDKREGVYYAVYSKKDLSYKMFLSFLKNFFNLFGDVAYSSFAEGMNSLSAREKKILLEKLDKILKNQNEK